MIGMDDFQRLIKVEIDRVKALSGRNGYWVESSREDNVVYRNDPVTCLKGVEKKNWRSISINWYSNN